jgi:putative RNA 2'-phosphotransferase
MADMRAIRISKLLSYSLRHEPETMGITLDRAGWADVSDLLDALRTRGEVISRQELVAVVHASDKQRFALSPDGTRIRANQGHSVDVDLGLQPSAPPPFLYHGTVARFLESIRGQGLLRRMRAHVHLSADVATAKMVAARRRGPIVILTVNAGAMHQAGHLFFRSANGVWLTEHVPPTHLQFPP